MVLSEESIYIYISELSAFVVGGSNCISSVEESTLINDLETSSNISCYSCCHQYTANEYEYMFSFHFFIYQLNYWKSRAYEYLNIQYVQSSNV